MKKTKEFLVPSKVKVIRNKKYGKQSRMVVATNNIRKDELIEESPIIRIPTMEVFENGEHSIRNPTISHYVFFINEETLGLALGFGSLYNHNDNPNAKFKFLRGDLFQLKAVKDIEKGEEVTIHYQQEDTEEPVIFNQHLPQ